MIFNLKAVKNYTLYIVLCTLFFSCSTSEYSDYEKTESGLLYKFHTQGTDTARPQYGDVVTLKMLKLLGDSMLDNSSLIYPDGVRRNLAEPAFKGAVEEGIHMMTIGDSATFLISTDSINKYFPARDSTNNFKPNDFLVFNVKLINIQTIEDIRWQEEQNRKRYMSERKELEPNELSQYIQDNHIEVKPTPSGLYFIESKKGKGVSPKDGDSVVVHCTGSFLNGTVFFSSLKNNKPIEFLVGDKSEQGGIEGWYEGIKKMKKGSIATLIVPSSLAYDSAGRTDEKGRYIISPYTPLKFDIQLLEIKSKK